MSDQKFCVAGEWEDEPDRESFVHAELPCLILRAVGRGIGGHLNGYVGVPKRHPSSGSKMKNIGSFMGRDGPIADVKYEDLEENVHVHGGLTFSGEGDGELRPTGFYWFGFDCAHAGDYSPPTNPAVHKIHVDVTGRTGPSDYETYRNIEYVRGQVKHLAEQLAAMWQPPSYEDWIEARRSEDGSSDAHRS